MMIVFFFFNQIRPWLRYLSQGAWHAANRECIHLSFRGRFLTNGALLSNGEWTSAG